MNFEKLKVIYANLTIVAFPTYLIFLLIGFLNFVCFPLPIAKRIKTAYEYKQDTTNDTLTVYSAYTDEISGNVSLVLIGLQRSNWEKRTIKLIGTFQDFENVVTTFKPKRVSLHNLCEHVVLVTELALFDKNQELKTVELSYENYLTNISLRKSEAEIREIVICTPPIYSYIDLRPILLSIQVHTSFGGFIQYYVNDDSVSETLKLLKNDGISVEYFEDFSSFEFGGLEIANSDCLHKYKTAAKFITFLDHDNLFIPKDPHFIVPAEFTEISMNYAIHPVSGKVSMSKFSSVINRRKKYLKRLNDIGFNVGNYEKNVLYRLKYGKVDSFNQIRLDSNLTSMVSRVVTSRSNNKNNSTLNKSESIIEPNNNVAKYQGIVSGYVQYGGEQCVEIFHQKYGYIVCREKDMDLTSSTGSWVGFTMKGIQNGPKNIPNKASNVVEVEAKYSQSPATDEFRNDNRHNLNQKVHVDYFKYESAERYLAFKTWVKYYRGGPNGEGFYNDYYGKVNMTKEDFARLMQHGVERLEVMLKLTPSGLYRERDLPWTVIHFMNNGKTYNMNGFLSIIGELGRGKGGHIRLKGEVQCRPDTLVLPNAQRSPQQRPNQNIQNHASNERPTPFGRQNVNEPRKNTGRPLGFGAMFPSAF